MFIIITSIDPAGKEFLLPHTSKNNKELYKLRQAVILMTALQSKYIP